MIKARLDTDLLSVRLGVLFAHLGISPNAWTVISIVPAILGFIALAVYQSLPGALVFFILAGFIDAIDGAVARVTSRVSSIGAFLDGVIDRYVEILIFLSILIYLDSKQEVFILSSSIWVALLIFGALMPTFVRAYADHKKIVTDSADLKKMGGFLERAERLFLIYVGLFLGIYFNSAIYLIYLIAFTAVLANLTAFQRILFALKYKKAE